ncbi:MAG: right-handed parallel beta-helix repeat-containing protein, partial [Nitrososphaeraceae archaeon]
SEYPPSEYPPSDYESNQENDYYNYPPTENPDSVDIVVPIDFDTIQEGIDAANEGDVIKVLPGTYIEQITINKTLTIIGSGAKSTIIEAPLPLANLERNIINLPYIVNIDNQAQVTIKGFTIKGIADTNCDTLLPITDRLLGISVFGGATLKLDFAVIKDCTFRSVFVGTLLVADQFGHSTITNTVITDFQNTGVFAVGSDTTLTMSHNKVLGSASDVDVPVGIFFSLAKGTITHNEVSGNICNIPGPIPFTCGGDWINQVQAFGIAATLAGEGSVISKNYVFNNDIGIGIFEASGCCVIDRNKLSDNEFFGIAIADGEHTVSNTKIFGGDVGVLAAAIFDNTTATLDRVKIFDAEIPVQALSTGNLTAAVNVLSPSIFLP